MHALHEGQLMWKEKVETIFGKITMTGRDRGFFHLTVSVKGIRLPVELRIYVDILEGDLVQIRDRFIESASVPLGEKRLEAIGDAVSDALYENRSLYAPIEQKDGFVFGSHFNFRRAYHRNPAITLMRKKRADLELLLTEKVEKEGKMVTVHAFYDPSNQTLLEGLADSWLEETWAANNTMYILRQLYTKRYDASQFVVDDQGMFYKVSTVFDPANIRLFTVHPKEFRCDIQTLASARKIRGTFTFKEALEEKTRHEILAATAVDLNLPYTDKHVTIYSERALGTALSDYPIGTYVQTKLGAFGVTTSPREGKGYEVCLESKYLPTERLFPHNELEAIENPYRKRTDEPMVHYRFQTAHQTYDGFGYLLEERPSVYKIRPVTKYGKESADKLQTLVMHEIRYNHRLQGVAIAKMKELHGEDLNFLLLPKEQVRLLDETSAEAVESFLNTDSVSIEETIFANLLELQEVHHLNLDYLLFSLVDYSAYVPLESMVKKLTELMLAHRKFGFVDACITWFEVLEAKKRVTVA